MQNQRKAGFTILELLVVMAIIGVLALAVLASVANSREGALVARALADMRNIQGAMEVMWNETGVYPHNQDSYCPPVNADNNEVDLTTTNLVNYTTALLDPWGNPYFFDQDYYCTAGAAGCRGQVSTGANNLLFSVLVSCGPDDLQGDDPSNPQPTNGIACAYNDDNIVYELCLSRS